MTNYREILRLHSLGINNTQIAQACGCARSTIVRVLQQAAIQGITWEQAQGSTNSDLSRRLFRATNEKPTYRMPDYDLVHRELQRIGVTLNLLWLEYCEQCRHGGELAYKSTQFNKYYADFVQKTKATMHLEHKPGEVLEVDWAGQTAAIIDTDTGATIECYLFVATLPHSGYTYAEAFLDMKEASWIAAHVNAYSFFGGVTRILTPDNLKTGIIKNTKSETVLNRVYQEMAEHYSTAVIPARPRTPKDKPSVEGAVGIISTYILAALRNRKFFSMTALNGAIHERLHGFNHKPFQKKEGSRWALFQEEKHFLQPLPPRPFELAVWKIATVQYNYHISTDQQNYSVPFEYIKQKVDVRLTKQTVEIFFCGARVASHVRLCGRPNQYSTRPEHMPPDHQKYLQWNGERFRSWAKSIGADTLAVVCAFLDRYKIEQQGYKACMALLKLADQYSSDRLDAACTKALTFTTTPSLKIVQTILKTGQDNLEPADAEPVAQYGFTRGASYYGGGGADKC